MNIFWTALTKTQASKVLMLMRPAVCARWALKSYLATKQPSRALATNLLGGIIPRKVMGSMASLTHEERTAAELRQPGLHTVTLDKIDQVSHNIRLLRLTPSTPEAKKSIKARQPNARSKYLLTFDTYSIVPPRPMARRARSKHTASGWFHYHIDT